MKIDGVTFNLVCLVQAAMAYQFFDSLSLGSQQSYYMKKLHDFTSVNLLNVALRQVNSFFGSAEVQEHYCFSYFSRCSSSL